MPINLDTVLAKLHVFHLCDILNAIKSWLWKCARTSLWWREITDVINMQTSSRWQTRLGFENLNYFCVIIYLPVHRFPFLISSRVPHARASIMKKAHLYLWCARRRKTQALGVFFRRDVSRLFRGLTRQGPAEQHAEPVALWALNLDLDPRHPYTPTIHLSSPYLNSV